MIEKREDKLMKLIFDNEKKINKLGKKLKKRKFKNAEIWMAIGVMYMLVKVAVKHEVEIDSLKKTIEELKSKGV